MKQSTLSRDALVRMVTKAVVEALQAQALPETPFDRAVKIGVSNRHVHLDRHCMDVLFGSDQELHPMKELGQPGQYASEETVILKGPKGTISHVRVLGPLRKQTQIEVSITDGFALGVKAPIRESGHLKGTPGITLLGPQGEITVSEGVIVAQRHIHMTPLDALNFGVKDGDRVRVSFDGIRGGILDDVVIRVSDKYALEMHIDVDEGNALFAKTGDFAHVLKDEDELQ